MKNLLSLLVLFLGFNMSFCSLDSNKLANKSYYTYHYSITPKRLMGISYQLHQIIEMKFSFTTDSVTIAPNLMMNSLSLKGMESLIKTACTPISYRYTYKNQTLNVFGGDITPSKLTFEGEYILFEDGSTLYSSGLSDFQTLEEKIVRIQKITGLDNNEIEEMLINAIYCN